MWQRDRVWLAEKAGGAGFTADDEELLVLFAAQAAVAIGNAPDRRTASGVVHFTEPQARPAPICRAGV